MRKPIPRPSILDGLEYLGVVNGQRRWRSNRGQRLYEWDGTHGEVEFYNGRGQHLGALDPVTGERTKAAVKGRRIDV